MHLRFSAQCFASIHCSKKRDQYGIPSTVIPSQKIIRNQKSRKRAFKMRRLQWSQTLNIHLVFIKKNMRHKHLMHTEYHCKERQSLPTKHAIFMFIYLYFVLAQFS